MMATTKRPLTDRLREGQRICASVGLEDASIYKEAADLIEANEAKMKAMHRCFLPVFMTMAQEELAGQAIPDDAVILSFMGSGASDQVTAGELRKAFDVVPIVLPAYDDKEPG